MPARYIKIKVTNLRLDETREDDDSWLEDEGIQARNFESEIDKEKLLSFLTKRQRQVAELLFAGYDRPQIAEHLTPPVCVQAVHQIILRIRKRLNQKAGVKVGGWKRRHGAY